MVDVGPLKRSRNLRLLVAGQLVSVLGTQMTMVAVPFQVYALTRSSLVVGLVSVTVLVPLLIGALGGGSLVDVTDRRTVLIITSAASATVSVGMALNSVWGPVLWPLFVGPAATALLGGLDDTATGAVLPNVVDRLELAAANAILQSLFQVGLVVGPALAGVFLALGGADTVYWIDAGTYCVSALTAAGLSRQLPGARDGSAGNRSMVDGLRFLRRNPRVLGAFVIDANATVFGMPRAVFPALAATVFGGGAATLGLLYAAPGFGALCGALTSGWVSRIRYPGRAVITAVVVWGGAIALLGSMPWLMPALVLLTVAGWADVISAILRSTIVALETPDALRGRIAGLHTGVVTGAPRIGDGVSGAAAALWGPALAATAAGLTCMAGATAIARCFPAFRRQQFKR